MDRAKPYDIPKREVWEAYKKVRANQGAAGVDGQTIADFEADLANNLYKLWNRLSSGSYLPPPVRRVDIPKSDGKTRPLGIPTVADRIAQMVVKRHLEPLVEPRFHPDSYGYRPGKSALDAVDMARQRCWRRDWVLDLDIKAFFDSIETDLLMRAVRKHTDWANMPAHLVQPLIDAGQLVRLTLEEPALLLSRIPMFGVYRRALPPGPAGRWFLDRLKEGRRP